VGVAKRVLSAVNSPWFWPIMPLLAVAMVGQWVSVIAAEVVATACAAIGIGVVIGLVVAGERGGVQRTPPDSKETSMSAANPTGPSATTAAADAGGTAFLRGADLRGALLANTTLVRADLRHADMRGVTLSGADLSGADLTDARLGPLEESDDSA
jgi:hypothetical protein